MKLSELFYGIIVEKIADPDDPRGNMPGVPFSGSTGSMPAKTAATPVGKAPTPSVVVQPVTAAVGAPHGPQPPTLVDTSAPGGAENTMDIPLQPARDGLPMAKGQTATA